MMLDSRVMTPGRQIITFLFLALILTPMLSGCDRNGTENADQTGSVVLQVWAHAGQQAERRVLKSQIERFNQQHEKVNVELTFIPERE